MLAKLAALLFLAAPLGCLHAQVNLNSTIPAPQVKGVVQPVNGGFGISTAGLTGCPMVNNGTWTISPANCSGSTGPFSINSFTGCNGSFELGASITNPVCNATYSSTPTSAQITNTDGISSPTVLTSPFTTGTITGTFSHTTTATTTITLTAIGSSTQTATQAYTWKPAIFGGVGASGATSAVTASGSTAILSNGAVLARAQLGAEVAGGIGVGTVLGPYTTSGTNVYLLLTGGSHTFIDPGTGFPFAFNTPTAVTFVNAFGVTVNMFLYQSTNPLYGTFSVRVQS